MIVRCVECADRLPTSKGPRPRRFCSDRCAAQFRKRQYFTRDYVTRAREGLTVDPIDGLTIAC